MISNLSADSLQNIMTNFMSSVYYDFENVLNFIPRCKIRDIQESAKGRPNAWVFFQTVNARFVLLTITLSRISPPNFKI